MDPLAQEWLDKTRDAHDPDPEAEARVRAKLDARLAAGGDGPVAGGRALDVGKAPWALKLLVPLIVTGSVVALIWPVAPPPAVERLALPSATLAPPPERVAEPPPAASPVPPPVESAPMSVAAPPHPAMTQPSSAHPHAATAGIEAELALLASAQAAIQRGDYATALAKLDEHQRSFPGGVLGEERTAARVVALCGAGKEREAQALATTFLAEHPMSPLAPRVRGACSGAGQAPAAP